MRHAVQEAPGAGLANAAHPDPCGIIARNEPTRFERTKLTPPIGMDSVGRVSAMMGIVFFGGMILAPLLEEKRDASHFACVADPTRPNGVHRPGALAAFTADNDPVELGAPLCVSNGQVADDACERVEIVMRIGIGRIGLVCPEVPEIDRPQQRLGADEADRCRGRQQIGNALFGAALRRSLRSMR